MTFLRVTAKITVGGWFCSVVIDTKKNRSLLKERFFRYKRI